MLSVLPTAKAVFISTSYSLETSSNVAFNVRRVGQGPQPVILVHGFGNPSAMWYPWPKDYKKYCFYLIDLPGFGSSRKTQLPRKADILEIYASCIEEVIKKFSLNGVLLGGFSLGAFSSLCYLTRTSDHKIKAYLHVDHPAYPGTYSDGTSGLSNRLLDKFDKVVALAPDEEEWIHPDFKMSSELQDAYSDALTTLCVLALDLEKWPYLPRSSAMKYSSQLWERTISRSWAMAIFKSYSNRQYDFRESVSFIKIPVSVVAGDRSVLVSFSSAKDFVSSLSNAQLIPFKGAGHDLMLKKPFKFSRVFNEFLDSNA